MNQTIRIAVTAVLLGIIAWRMRWSELAAQFGHMRLEFWCAALALYILAQVASARRWQLIAQEFHFKHTLSQYCAYYFIGMYFSLLLPTSVGGDLMRVWYLKGDSNRRWDALTSVVLERLNGLAVLIVLACGGTLLASEALPWWMMLSVWSLAVSALLGLLVLPRLQHWHGLSEQRRQQLQRAWQLLCSPQTLCESTFLSILTQCGGVLMVWCLGLGLGLQLSFSSYCILVPMVSLLMLLPLSVNGMGVREAGSILFLAPLGVDETTALSLAFLWFSIGVAGSLIGGAVYLCGSSSKKTASPLVPQQASC